MNLKVNATDYLTKLKKISLDKAQADDCTLPAGCEEWLELRDLFKEDPDNIRDYEKGKKRKNS